MRGPERLPPEGVELDGASRLFSARNLFSYCLYSRHSEFNSVEDGEHLPNSHRNDLPPSPVTKAVCLYRDRHQWVTSG